MTRCCTGIAWRDLPERYGPWQTVYTQFRRQAADGTFDRLLTALHTPQVSSRDGRVSL